MSNIKLLALFPLLIILFCSTTTGFNYGVQKIRGANLGAWLILEKWMTPNVFSGLPDNIIDEYSLCQYLGKDKALARLKQHWDTWITENDIIALKNAGINHLRIPVGYWALDIRAGEPYVAGSWDYVMKAVQWAKNQGLQVMIDLHGVPGSQNGNDHSGHASGRMDFFYNDDNLNRATKIVGKIAQTFKTDQWKNTVKIIEVLNEPILWGDDYNFRLGKLKQYYRQAYDEIRKYSSDVVVAVHDAFIDYNNWYYLRDDSHYYWVMLDTHLYQVFGDKWKSMSCDQHTYYPCSYIQKLAESNNKLWTVVGEWSLATPMTCGNKADFARQQIGVYEGSGSGWFFWSAKLTNGWNDWSFLDSVRLGSINLKNTNTAKC